MKPWWIEDSVPYVEKLLNKDMVVFEYGSGRSTIWFAERVKKIYSVEYQEKWMKQVQQWADDRKLNNIELMFCPKEPEGPYCRTIEQVKEPIDFLIVDGRNRVESFITALPYLKSNAIVVLDDSQRSRYTVAKELLDSAWKEVSWQAPPRTDGKSSKKTSVYLPK